MIALKIAYKYLIRLLFVALLCIAALFTIKMAQEKPVSIPQAIRCPSFFQHRVTLPTRHNVWHYIRNHHGLIFDSIVYQQCIRETGLTAHWVTENNNLLCLRYPKSRKTTALWIRNGYAVYPSWQSCIDDYAILQNQFTGKTKEDYYTFLENLPYGDSTYVDSLRTFKVTFPK